MHEDMDAKHREWVEKLKDKMAAHQAKRDDARAIRLTQYHDDKGKLLPPGVVPKGGIVSKSLEEWKKHHEIETEKECERLIRLTDPSPTSDRPVRNPPEAPPAAPLVAESAPAAPLARLRILPASIKKLRGVE